MPVRKYDKELPTTMRTLSEVLETLKERGYDTELTYQNGVMYGFNKAYNPEELVLIRTFRFEGLSDPADNVAIYLVEDQQSNVGYIMDVYGSDSNYGEGFNDFLRKIPNIADSNP